MAPRNDVIEITNIMACSGSDESHPRAVLGFISLPVVVVVTVCKVVWSGFEGWLFHPDETPYGEEIPSTAIMGLG